jgi:hypothetical protein
MRILSPSSAAAGNYRSITRPIHRTNESEIFESIKANLDGTDSVWIDVGGGQFEAARHRSQVILDERKRSSAKPQKEVAR